MSSRCRRLLLRGGNWPRVDGAHGSGRHERGAGSGQPGLSVSATGIRPGAGATPLSPVLRFYKKLPSPLISHAGWLLEAKRIKCCRDGKVLNKKRNNRQFHLELGQPGFIFLALVSDSLEACTVVSRLLKTTNIPFRFRGLR